MMVLSPAAIVARDVVLLGGARWKSYAVICSGCDAREGGYMLFRKAIVKLL